MKTKKTLKETVVEGIYREIEEGIYKPTISSMKGKSWKSTP